MKIIYPDYTNSLLNLMSSIRKFFNLEIKNPTLKAADEILESGNYRTVILFLMDGMGSKILEHHLSEDSLLRSHKVTDFLSTFPSTTVAATTCVRTTLSPMETGWLGWHQYLDEVKDDVIVFNGMAYYNDKNYDKHIGFNLLPYRTFFDELSDNGYRNDEYFPHWGEHNPVKKFNEEIKQAIKFANSGVDKQYLYCYWDQPDHDLHLVGTKAKSITRMLKKYDSLFKKLEKNLPEDSVVFVIADHGHIDSKSINLADYPDFLETLEKLPSIDSRNSTFFVYEDKNDKFVELFNKYFSDSFNLHTRQEVIDKQFFGPNPNKAHYRFLGDYQACATSNKLFSYNPTHEKLDMVSAHAGITEDEMVIPLIKITKK